MPGARAGVADRVGHAVEVAGDGSKPTLVQLIAKQETQVERALPSHLKASASAFTSALITVVRQTPTLQQCDPQTVLGGLIIASQLGLEFGPLGHAYLVPFNNRRTGKKEAQFIIGYKGAIDLCWRSGKLLSIAAREVCENDEFDFDYGLADSLHHKIDVKTNRGEPYAWYSVAKFVGGGHYFVVLGKDEVEKHRKMSKSGEVGPWKDNYSEMALKTTINVARPMLPLTTEVSRQLSYDSVVASGTSVDDLATEEVDYIDVDPVDGDTGEIRTADGSLPLEDQQ